MGNNKFFDTVDEIQEKVFNVIQGYRPDEQITALCNLIACASFGQEEREKAVKESFEIIDLCFRELLLSEKLGLLQPKV